MWGFHHRGRSLVWQEQLRLVQKEAQEARAAAAMSADALSASKKRFAAIEEGASRAAEERDQAIHAKVKAEAEAAALKVAEADARRELTASSAAAQSEMIRKMDGEVQFFCFGKCCDVSSA